jgi:hypothetical protein
MRIAFLGCFISGLGLERHLGSRAGAYNFQALGVAKLTQILSNLEPSTLNSFNLKGLLPRGQRANNKQVLLEILCVACGVSAQDTLTPHRTYSAVEKSLAALYEKLGHRRRGLVLPLDWQVSGAYSFRWHGEQLLLKHKFMAGTPEVAAPEAFANDIVDKKRLTLLNNYPETQATLVEEHTVKSIVMKGMFSEVGTPARAEASASGLGRREADPSAGAGASGQKQPAKKRKNLGKAAASIMKKWKHAAPAGVAKPATGVEARPAAFAVAAQGGIPDEVAGDSAAELKAPGDDDDDELSMLPPGPDGVEA